MVNCDVGMVINGGRCPEMSLSSFPKGPLRLTYILLSILQPVTLVPVDYSNFLCDGVLRGHGEVYCGVATFEIDLDFYWGNIPIWAAAILIGATHTVTWWYCMCYNPDMSHATSLSHSLNI